MGWVQFFLAESQSRLYPHMRAKFGSDPTAGSKKLPLKFIIGFVDLVFKNIFLAGKGMFLYSTVSSPLERSNHFTLFLLCQTCSFRHHVRSVMNLFQSISTITFFPPRINALFRANLCR